MPHVVSPLSPRPSTIDTTPPKPSRLIRPARAGGVAVLAAAIAFLGAGTASAHVRVFPDTTATGAFSALTFRVPNESDTAGTVKVQVQLPQDTPFLYVSSKPVPGWTAKTTEETLPKPFESEGTTITKAVRTVTWTADRGTEIAPGQYQEFALSVGPLPAPGTVLLPATQTYSDGKVVKWDEPTPASGDEPENPAPALVVTAAGTTGSGGMGPMGSTSPTAAPTLGSAPTAEATTSGSDPDARVLGGAALVVAAAGLVLAVTARRRRTARG